MIEHLSPDDVDEAEFLAGLNECFPRWGGAQAFDWAFRSRFDGLCADMLVAREAGRLIAGSAVTYRRLRRGDGEEVRVAIMTGSWTLPAERQRGFFSRMISAMLDLARDRGASMLHGFGRTENASRRRIEAAGARSSPAYYCHSNGQASEAAPDLDETGPAIESIDADSRLFESVRTGTRFVYAPAEWRTQFVSRPGNVHCIGVPGLWAAVVETAGDFDRVHALATTDEFSESKAIRRLAARAHRSGRRLFFYTTLPARLRDLEAAGFEAASGLLYMLPISHPVDVHITDWNFQNGDRM